jgi:hypothetical protein
LRLERTWGIPIIESDVFRRSRRAETIWFCSVRQGVSFEALRLLWSLKGCGIMLVAPPQEMVQSEGTFVLSLSESALRRC